MTDIHDIKPLLDLGGDRQWLLYWIGIAAVLMLLALARWLWKRRRKVTAPSQQVTPAIAPDEEALSALDALAAGIGLSPKQYYFRLSTILRRYMEHRFDFPAAEMTTEELLPHVDRLSLDRSLVTALKAFCREADPIKFAGAEANQDQAALNMDFCRNFVHQTREIEQESDM